MAAASPRWQPSAVRTALPADAAIPPTRSRRRRADRQAIPEIRTLQPSRGGGGLGLVANLVVLICSLALIGAISWGIGRYPWRAADREPHPDAPADAPSESAPTSSGLGNR